MTKFIKQITIFFIALLAILNAPIILFDKLFEMRDIFIVPSETEYLILGNSRPELALNDKLINKSYNFAHSGEAYFITYTKAKEIVKNNDLSNIKAVFLQFTPTDVSDHRDSWVWETSKLQSHYPKYLHAFDLEDIKILAKKNLEGLISVHFFQTSLRQLYNLCRFNKKELRKSYGGYFSTFHQFSNSVQNVPTLHFSKQNHHKNRLVKTIQLFQSQGIPVFLINCPVHPSKREVEKKFQAKDYLISQDINVEYLDFSDFPLKDEEYADRSHLNFYGAKQFSEFFNTLLEKELLSRKNKQEFVYNQKQLWIPITHSSIQ